MLTARVWVLLAVGLVSNVSAQAITVGALQSIFKYATPATVKTVTTNVNAKKTAPDQKTVLNAWIPKNFKPATAKVVAGDKLANASYVKTKAGQFIDSRFSVKKYCNFSESTAISTKVVTTAEAKKLTALFWKVDKQTNNNFTLTCQKVAAQVPSVVNKTGLIEKMHEIGGAFQKAYPKDFANLFFTL